MDKTIRALFEDDYLIIFDKRPGLLVIPSPRDGKPTLTELVNRQYPLPQKRLHPCHRLDRDTSGVILYAKGKRHQKMLMALFHRHAVEKTYLAFVRGRMKPGSGTIKTAVSSSHYGKRSYPVSFQRKGRPKAKPAVTRYRVLSVRKGYSIVEAYPLTGRTHQIRIHFRDCGHPLLGERLYAFGRDFPVNFRRLALHASKISFRHPVEGRKITVTAPVPDDMRLFMSKSKTVKSEVGP